MSQRRGFQWWYPWALATLLVAWGFVVGYHWQSLVYLLTN